jgi:Ca2+-transporting ATPase
MAGKWHLMSEMEVLEVFRSHSDKGLEERDAAERLARFGPNELNGEMPASAGQVLLGQFRDLKLLGLLIIAAVTGLLGEFGGASAVIIIALINALVGFIQEYRTERIIDRSKGVLAPEAQVIRGGQEKKIPASNLVPGDLVLLGPGDSVPADMRLIWTSNLIIEETALHGRAAAVKKFASSGGDTAESDRRENMALLESTVVSGSGKGIVVATGMLTEAGLIAGVDGKAAVPGWDMQECLAAANSRLFYAGLFICLLVIILGIYRGESLLHMLLTGISLAIAAVPGGLPAVARFSLALGLRRIKVQHAVIRYPARLEKLACVTVFCTNKTGTLTGNKMSVARALVNDNEVEISGEGYDPKGGFVYRGEKNDPGLRLFLKAAALCNNARLVRGDITVGGLFRDIGKGKAFRQWGVQGDPTEGALLVMAARGGVWRERLEKKESRVHEILFDSRRRRMTVICRAPGGGETAYSKGAPEELLELCTHLYAGGIPVIMTAARREELLKHINDMAASSFRVVAMAYRELPPEINNYAAENVEKHMVFLGLAGMLDVLEPAAVGTLHSLRRAGIKVIMVTGEHQLTARSLAAEAGLLGSRDGIITGGQVAGMSDGELAREIEHTRVFARIDPQQKHRIVRILKQSGQVVAVTGKGAGDISALREADIGVSMGDSGAAALKDVSSILLTGNGIGGFTDVLRECRGIYDNIKTILHYLLTLSVSLLLLVTAALAAGLPLPLLPVQVLWAGLLVGGIPVLALGMEPPDRNVLFRGPGDFREKVFSSGVVRSAVISGVLAGAASLAVFWLLLRGGAQGQDLARAAALNTIIILQMFYAFSYRYKHYIERESLSRTSPALAASLMSVLALQFAVTYLPFLRGIFHTAPLEPVQWGSILAIIAVSAISEPVLRWLRSRAGQKIMYFKI